jgi:nitrogen fixation protein NifB
LLKVAQVVKDLGAYTMNIIPMIPLAKFEHIVEPSDDEVNRVRDECETVIQQFRNCMRCRADAIGVPGEDGGCGSASDEDAETVCSPKFLQDKPILSTNSEEPAQLA